MSPRHRYQTWFFDFLARSFLLLFLFSLPVGCRSASEEPSVPTATPVPATRAVPTPMAALLHHSTEAPNATVPSTGTASLSSFVLPLSEDWSYLLLDEATYRDKLSQAADLNLTLQAAVVDLFTNRQKPPQLLVAWPHSSQQRIGLLAYVLPSPNWTLPRYLTAIEAQLSAAPTFRLRTVETLFSLRDDHPVGYTHYTIAIAEEGTFQGYHYALFNDKATELLLLTFVTKSEVPAADNELQPLFAALVQEVRFNSALVE